MPCLVLEPLRASAWSRQAASSPGSSATCTACALLWVGYGLALLLEQLQHRSSCEHPPGVAARLGMPVSPCRSVVVEHRAQFAARSKAKARRGRGDAPLQGCYVAVCHGISKHIPRGIWESLKLPRRACLRAIL